MTIGENSTYVLTIEPNGLLVDNMIVQGHIELHTEEGQQWIINVELRADSEDDEFLATYRTPGRIIALLMFTLTLYFAAMTFQTPQHKGTIVEKDAMPEEQGEASQISEELDPWGRVIDETLT